MLQSTLKDSNLKTEKQSSSKVLSELNQKNPATLKPHFQTSTTVAFFLQPKTWHVSVLEYLSEISWCCPTGATQNDRKLFQNYQTEVRL